MGLLNEEDEQNLEMDIDLSKIDRNCMRRTLFISISDYFSLCIVLGCVSKRKPVNPIPSKRKRTTSRMNF